MNSVASMRKVASFLLTVGLLVLGLTVVQPKPSVDTLFRIGAAVAIAVAVVLLVVAKIIEARRGAP
jgi:hypothetical protein